jgi:hypothetical protein
MGDNSSGEIDGDGKDNGADNREDGRDAEANGKDAEANGKGAEESSGDSEDISGEQENGGESLYQNRRNTHHTDGRMIPYTLKKKKLN